MMRMRAALLSLPFILCGIQPGWAADKFTGTSMAFALTSPAFEEGSPIPAAYTCDGKNGSPPLQWTSPPPGTNSLALIMDDPDAPMGTWVHWVLYNLPPSVRQLSEAMPPEAQWPDGTAQGTTSFGRVGYGGPCPPSGTHQYLFKLYALDLLLPLGAGANTPAVESAMRGHLIAQAQLMGTYRRRGR